MKQLNQKECEDDIKKSLIVAMDRLDMELKDIDNTVKDILTEFSYLNIKQIREIIRLGSLGKYGKSFKFNTQEICYWIREYLKENNAKTLGI